MTIRFLDGFDLYANISGVEEQWGTVGTVPFTTTGGRFGGGAINSTSFNQVIFRSLVDNQDYLTIGFAFKSNLSGAVRTFAWTDVIGSITAGDINAAMMVNTDGSITIEGDSGADRGTSSSGLIVADTWYYVEIQANRSASGNMEVFVNGISAISAAGDYLESTVNSSLSFGTMGTVGNVFIDDIYINEDASASPAIFGDSRIETLLPDADTAVTDWTRNTGSNDFEAIDDALGTNGDGDTTYVSDTTLNNKSEFDMASLGATPTAVRAVAINTRATKTDAGAIAYTQYIDSNGTEANGVEVAPSETGYDLNTDIFETDPDTSVAWTLSGVNAAKLGVEITS